ELRLVGGGGRCAGRVEVKHRGEWGSVCVYDFDWDSQWASVVCRQLGCGAVAKASVYAPFGQGTGRIWLQPFFCRGVEEMLQDCPNFGWGQHFCGHELDVGVTCADAVELRLAGGRGPCSGKVEVKLRGRWGSVGDASWDLEDAEVVCQQLGCGSAAGAYPASIFGTSDGPISLAIVDCNGDEGAIWECEIRGWGPYTAIHDFDTAVVCQGFARLVGGAGACEGRLEVRQGRAWHGLCEDAVDMKAARVVCQELGCGTALALLGTDRFEAGTGPLWDGRFECEGTESLLSACARRPPRGQGCASRASIICSSYTGFRLAGSGSNCSGRAEVEAGGAWRSLCATAWHLPDAHVFCHHLGCGPAATLAPGGTFGNGTVLQPGALGCVGSERHPGECPAVVLGAPGCPPGHAAAVRCSGAAGTSWEKPCGCCSAVSSVPAGGRRVRLAGGPGRCAGRVEIFLEGSWASVCQDGWAMAGASVVCHQLGCGKALAAPGSARFGAGTGQPWAGGSGCVGTEEALWDCPAGAWHGCQRGGGAGAICSELLSLRLVGSSRRCQGHLEVLYNGTWGRVCANGTKSATAATVCRQLGCGYGGRLGASPAEVAAPAWLAWVGCEEGAQSLWQCPSAPW
ncbi:C163A protein, partial [Centropus unirufus]|nr:C163A protein [Centropus unirufus]